VKGLFRSLLLLAGLACLPACAASQVTPQQQPSAPSQQSAPVPSAPANPQTLPSPTPTQHRVEVRFDKGSAEVRASAMQILYGAVQELRGQRITSVRVVGYTDASGRRAFNQRLSQQRAEAVADQLRKLNLRAEQTEVVGAGEVSPHGKKAKRSRVAEDRRVEIIIETVPEATAAQAPAPTSALTQAQGPLSAAAAPMTPDAIMAPTSQTLAIHMPVWLQPANKPAIKRDPSAQGTTWLPPPAA
jgi:outer membrane protein OmpA-like peptidoglycan-associated protein